jgi:hypothetical protein
MEDARREEVPLVVMREKLLSLSREHKQAEAFRVLFTIKSILLRFAEQAEV